MITYRQLIILSSVDIRRINIFLNLSISIYSSVDNIADIEFSLNFYTRNWFKINEAKNPFNILFVTYTQDNLLGITLILF